MKATQSGQLTAEELNCCDFVKITDGLYRCKVCDGEAGSPGLTEGTFRHALQVDEDNSIPQTLFVILKKAGGMAQVKIEWSAADGKWKNTGIVPIFRELQKVVVDIIDGQFVLEAPALPEGVSLELRAFPWPIWKAELLAVFGTETKAGV